jgi:hypothetical protein
MRIVAFARPTDCHYGAAKPSPRHIRHDLRTAGAAGNGSRQRVVSAQEQQNTLNTISERYTSHPASR